MRIAIAWFMVALLAVSASICAAVAAEITSAEAIAAALGFDVGREPTFLAGAVPSSEAPGTDRRVGASALKVSVLEGHRVVVAVDEFGSGQVDRAAVSLVTFGSPMRGFTCARIAWGDAGPTFWSCWRATWTSAMNGPRREIRPV